MTTNPQQQCPECHGLSVTWEHPGLCETCHGTGRAPLPDGGELMRILEGLVNLGIAYAHNQATDNDINEQKDRAIAVAQRDTERRVLEELGALLEPLWPGDKWTLDMPLLSGDPLQVAIAERIVQLQGLSGDKHEDHR